MSLLSYRLSYSIVVRLYNHSIRLVAAAIAAAADEVVADGRWACHYLFDTVVVDISAWKSVVPSTLQTESSGVRLASASVTSMSTGHVVVF